MSEYTKFELAGRNINIEHARLKLRNFSGKPTKYHKLGGNMDFGVIISPEFAEELDHDGWAVKWSKPLNPDYDPDPFLMVGLRFDFYPPEIQLISGRGMTLLDEDTVGGLDYDEFANVDLVIRPYDWQMENGDKGRKAMLKKMYATLDEDPFAHKYYDVGRGGN